MAFHDEDGRRIFGDARRIRDIPRAEIPAPTLAEVLAETPEDRHIVLELKEALVPPLGAFPPSHVTLIAFDPAIIAAAKRALPAARALWLFGDYASVWRNRGQWLAERVRELGVDGVDLRFARHLHARLLAPLREDRRVVFTYTVNSARQVRRCAGLGLDGLTTDRPADARRWLERTPPGISA